MFNLKNLPVKKANDLFETQRLGISTMRIFFLNARLLKIRPYEFISLETYNDFYREILDDIELVSPPLDTLIPENLHKVENEDDSNDLSSPMFSINTEVPEFKQVTDRVKLDVLFAFMPDTTNSTYVKMKEHPENLPYLQEEVFAYFLYTKYIQELDLINLELISTYTDLIEYVVKNVDEKALRNFIHTTKIDFDKKFKEKKHELMFTYDFDRVVRYYCEPHKDIPVIDVEKLLGLLFTNSDSKMDDIIIVAIFYILSYAINDIESEHPTDTFPHVKYIRDVLSKIK